MEAYKVFTLPRKRKGKIMKLIVKNLKKKFDKKEVLKGINFEFEKGKIYGLLGRNGARKNNIF